MPPMSLHLEVMDGQNREGSSDGEKVDKPQEKNPDGTGRGARARRAEGSCLIRFDSPPTNLLSPYYIHTNMYHHYQFQPSRMKL
jgi:hypothetical protein